MPSFVRKIRSYQPEPAKPITPPARHEAVRVEATERAAVEDQRLPARSLEVDHLADHEVVIARGVDRARPDIAGSPERA